MNIRQNFQSNILLFIVFLSAFIISIANSTRANDLAPPPVRPHLLMDAGTGEIMSMEMPFVRWAPASLTKMMTAYTVFKQLELQHIAMNSPVKVSEYALSQPPTKMGMPVGTIMTIEAALNIIMVKSANDISVALAESVAGSEEAFVGLMNSHARRLGMVDSQFINPHGLHDPMQYTSARDMALLAHTITENMKKYDEFFNIPGIRVGKRRLRNHNALVERFPGTTGMKTGYVCASGSNIVVRTEREGKTLIAVVLGGKSGRARNITTAKLLQEGFAGKLPNPGVTIDSLTRPEAASKIPKDITSRICPGKYAASVVPDVRPDDAPKAQEFDKIDTQLTADVVEKKKSDGEEIPVIIPLKRPKVTIAEVTPKVANAVAGDVESENQDVEIEQEAVLEDTPPTLRELEGLYLTPRIRVRDDVQITLGGATGPNPNGIKHTDGGRYVPPIPVPSKNPS